MTSYISDNAQSLIARAEFSPLPEGNFSFFQAQSPEKADALKQLLTSREIGQEIVAQSEVGGLPMLVTRGAKNSGDLINALSDAGQKLHETERDKKFDPWKWRGRFSNIGQTLNLISGYRKEGKVKGSKITFAVMNFAASGVNAAFGGQKSEDEYQLLHLKQNINTLLEKQLPDGSVLPDINDDRSGLRAEAPKPRSLSERGYDLMKANSVRIGEIGLRYLGSVALVFPMEGWKKAVQGLRKGGFNKANISEVYKAASNQYKDKTLFYTGITYLIGKTTGLFSKVPDPYNPEPTSTLDKIREKYLFKASSAIETGAAAVLAYGSFQPQEIPKGNKVKRRDYIGATAGVTLMGGLMTRLFAKFGSKEVDMDELYAHTTDALAQAPADKLPQLIAESAAYIKNHFEDKSADYEKIYVRLMTDLYKYHRIPIENAAAVPEPVMTAPENTQGRFTQANPSRRAQGEFAASATASSVENAPALRGL